MEAARGLLRRSIPWLVAAGLIVFVFSRVPIAEVLATARAGHLERFVPLVVAGAFAWFALESAAYAYLFSRFNAPLSWREARALRGMTYLLTILHYNAGKAGVVLRLRQTKAVPLLEGTSSVLLYQAVDGLVLASLATIGLAALAVLPRAGVATPIGVPVWTTASVVLATVLFLALIRFDWPRLDWLDRLRRLSLHRSQRTVGLRDLAVLAGIKIVFHAIFVVVFYAGPRAFGVEPPLALVIAATPIILVVGALPITPAGLGTQQAAMLFFFTPPDLEADAATQTEAAILAFGFGFPLLLIATRSVIGLFYLRHLPLATAAASDPVATSAAPIPFVPPVVDPRADDLSSLRTDSDRHDPDRPVEA